MKSLLTKEVLRRAAFAVAALVLFASMVAGREAPPKSAAVAAPELRPAAEGPKRGSALDLDLEKLMRPRNQDAIHDLFALRNPAPQQPGAAPPVAAPVAPPLPFQYLGRIIEEDKTTIFLIRGDQHYSVEPGRTLDKLYKVEQVADNAITFTYLPLGTRQVLTVPALN